MYTCLSRSVLRQTLHVARTTHTHTTCTPVSADPSLRLHMLLGQHTHNMYTCLSRSVLRQTLHVARTTYTHTTCTPVSDPSLRQTSHVAKTTHTHTQHVHLSQQICPSDRLCMLLGQHTHTHQRRWTQLFGGHTNLLQCYWRSLTDGFKRQVIRLIKSTRNHSCTFTCNTKKQKQKQTKILWCKTDENKGQGGWMMGEIRWTFEQVYSKLLRE